jgi:hypothetical protein
MGSRSYQGLPALAGEPLELGPGAQLGPRNTAALGLTIRQPMCMRRSGRSGRRDAREARRKSSPAP